MPSHGHLSTKKASLTRESRHQPLSQFPFELNHKGHLSEVTGSPCLQALSPGGPDRDYKVYLV